MNTVLRLLILAAAALSLSGCAATYYRDAAGVRFLRVTLGTDQQIGPVDLDGKTGRLKVGGVQSQQAAAAGAVAGAVIEAAKPKLLP